MIVLTPQLASRALDAFGAPQHLEPFREITLDDARLFLRVTDQRARIRQAARATKLPEKVVAQVWRWMVR